MLGLGLSGPQVVEGWYGRPFPRSPLTATREYVDVVRQVLRREAPVELDGRYHPLPYDGPDGTGIGKALKPITHPLRAGLPVLLGAEGPKNIAQTARIADGWLPLYWSPSRTEVYEASLTDAPEGFLVAPMARARVCDDIAEGLLPVKAMLGFYIGGMGHARRNFHADLMARMGYEEEARRIQQLFLDGRREEAVLAVPDAFADEISLVGPRERIAERLESWRKGPVTDLLVLAPDPHTLRVLAELANGPAQLAAIGDEIGQADAADVGEPRKANQRRQRDATHGRVARERTPGRLERVALVVQRVQAMSLDELRRASTARVT